MTTPKLTLYDFPSVPADAAWESFSPFVMKIDRALKLARLPYARKRILPTRIGKLNPSGQLPVLAIDGENVADSTRILQRIEALAPGALTGELRPAQLAEAWLWEEFGDVGLYPYALATRWADDRNWPQTREHFFAKIPAPVRAVVAPIVRRKIVKNLAERDFTRPNLAGCWVRMATVLDQLDARAPKDGFWLGQRPTVADLSLFAHLHALRLPFTPWQAGEVAQRVRLSRWLDRVDAATRSPA